MKGTIFDIKEFSVHDGPGSRVTVFFKGCPLRCKWCHNPEGLKSEQQIVYKQQLCKHCGLCMKPCDHPDCQPFGRCVHRCSTGALAVAGKVWESADLIKKLEKFFPVLESMGGGITLSGGEPLFQPDFAVELLEGLTGTHRAIQTSGYASEENFKRVIENVDYVMMDIKLADPQEHRKWTGVDNAPILSNLKILKESGKPHLFRTPLIPGVTDTEENLRAIAEIAGDSPVELLEYNSFAPAKYPMVGMEYPLTDLPEKRYPDISFFKNATLSKL